MYTFIRWSALAMGVAILSLAGCAQPSAQPPRPGMTASVTYLHLLAKVPFFAALSNDQLQWVIDHSREWSVTPGTEIAGSTRGADSFWVLLDGGWEIEHAGRSVKAGRADPAKWYGGREMKALGGDTRLVATARSYVMEIQQADLDEMLRQGFGIAPQLQDGMRAYRSLLSR